MDQRRHGTETDTIRDQVVAIALEHHLVSKYTSLIAVDITPSRKQDEALRKRPIPTNLPAGWQYDKVFGRMPATATPAALNLLAGALLLLMTLLLRLTRRYTANV